MFKNLNFVRICTVVMIVMAVLLALFYHHYQKVEKRNKAQLYSVIYANYLNSLKIESDRVNNPPLSMLDFIASQSQDFQSQNQ